MPRTSDLTVGQVRNLIDAAIQKRKFDPDLPFSFFMETTDDRQNSCPSGKPLGDRKARSPEVHPGATGLPSGSAGGSAGRAERFAAEAEAATSIQSTGW